MLAIRLPPDIEERLEKLAKQSGRTKTFYAREAILEHIEDLEDYYLAARTAKRVAAGKEGTLPLEQVERMIGVDDRICSERRQGALEIGTGHRASYHARSSRSAGDRR